MKKLKTKVQTMYDLGVQQAELTLKGDLERAKQVLEQGMNMLAKEIGNALYIKMIINFTAGYRVRIGENNHPILSHKL